MTQQTNPQLDNAPEQIKLAVDLIYLLESNNIEPTIALEAIEIVREDLQRKIDLENNQQTNG